MSEPSYEELRVELEETKQKLQSCVSKFCELGVTDWELKPKEEEKVVIKTCHHIKENGWCCGSAAVTDRNYCHFHLSMRGRRLKMARARGERCLLQLPPLEDLYGVQVGIQQVLDALLSGQLDRRMGGVVLYGLQQAASNLRLPAEVWEESSRFDNVGKTTWAGFEQAHGLPEGFNVDTPPEEAFPPPVTSPGTVELTGEDLVTEDDVELEDLLARDPEACKRRALQLARKYRQRLHHEEQKLARACRILEAARRNDEARKKEPATVKAETASVDGSADVSSEPDPGSPASAGGDCPDRRALAGVETASAVGGGAKKSPQGESIKKDEGAEDAS